MAEKASTTAKLALFISIAGTAFSAFQWWNGTRESRINATIEISKAFFSDLDRATLDSIVSVMKSPKDLSVEQMSLYMKFADRMSYVALLANTGRLDRAYLYPGITCSISLISRLNPLLRKAHPSLADQSTSDDREINEFPKDPKCESHTVIKALPK